MFLQQCVFQWVRYDMRGYQDLAKGLLYSCTHSMRIADRPRDNGEGNAEFTKDCGTRHLVREGEGTTGLRVGLNLELIENNQDAELNVTGCLHLYLMCHKYLS